MCLLVFGAAQVVQGAPEPGGHKAAGGDGRLCTRIPGTFGQLAGKHADQDQSRWWVHINLALTSALSMLTCQLRLSGVNKVNEKNQCVYLHLSELDLQHMNTKWCSLMSCLSQGSTGSCAWSQWRTSTSVRSKLPASTGRWEVKPGIRLVSSVLNHMCF